MKAHFGWIVGAAVVVLLAFGVGYGAYPLLHTGAPFASPAAQAAAAVGVDAQTEGLTPFWEAWGLLDTHYYGEAPPPEERFHGAVAGMVATFDDPYTMVLPPANNELDADHMRGSFGGIGATIELSGTRFLLNPLADHPAALAGVQRNDELRAIDGVTVTIEMGSDEVVAALRGEVGSDVTLALRRALTSTASAAGTAAGTAAAKGTAEVTATVTLTVTPASADAPAWRDFTVTLTRAEIRTPSVVAALLPDSTVGHLQQTSFTERSAQELEAALQELVEAGADRFIWDLRGNPGGLLDAAIDTTDLWLRRGAIVIEERAEGAARVFNAHSGGGGERFPLVVLVDGNSASASEIAAGALQDAGRARLVGSRTYGKGSVQTLYELSDASSLHVTTAQWLTPNRRQISGGGLAPDIAVEADADALAAALDAVLAQPLP